MIKKYFLNAAVKEVEKDGMLLSEIPEALKTVKICKAAVKQNYCAFVYVPEKLKTYSICKSAVKSNGGLLEEVPYDLRTPELCEIAVKKNGYAISCVPEKVLTKEMCITAVKDNGWALQYVPDKFKTFELCEIAISSYGDALEYVPSNIVTNELSIAAIKSSYRAIIYVPNKKEFLLKYSRYIENYLKNTFKKDHDQELVALFLKKASLKKIDELGDYICWNKIKNLPFDKLPLLINTSSNKLKKYVYKRLSIGK